MRCEQVDMIGVVARAGIESVRGGDEQESPWSQHTAYLAKNPALIRKWDMFEYVMGQGGADDHEPPLRARFDSFPRQFESDRERPVPMAAFDEQAKAGTNIEHGGRRTHPGVDGLEERPVPPSVAKIVIRQVSRVPV